MTRRQALKLVAAAPLALAAKPVQVQVQKLVSDWTEARMITIQPGSLYDFLLSAHGPFEHGPLSGTPINKPSQEELRKLFLPPV